MSDRVYVYKNAVAIEPKQLLVARQKRPVEDVLHNLGGLIAADEASVRCPISESGTLNFEELYRDGKVAPRRYFLPVYAIATSVHPEPPQKRYNIRLELTTNPARAGSLTVQLEGTWKASPGPGASGITEYLPLPHRATVALRFRVGVDLADPNAISTWKEIPFGEILQDAYLRITAVVHFPTLPEFDAVHHALTSPPANCQLLVRYEAEIAKKNGKQVFIPKEVPVATTVELPQLPVLYKLPTAKLSSVEAMNVSAKIKIQFRQPAVHGGAIAVGAHPAAGTACLAIGTVHVAADSNDVLSKATAHVSRAYPVLAFPDHTKVNRADWNVVAGKLREKHGLPSTFFGDSRGEPAYIQLTQTRELPLPCCFDPTVHGYIYPSRAPDTSSGLIPYGVSPDQLIYQDNAQRHVFYLVPDEFRIARDDVPPYPPSLDVAFTSKLNEEGEPSDDEAELSVDYETLLTFRAVPYMQRFRTKDALKYIADHALVPSGTPASLLPLVPQWSQLVLSVPKAEGSGSQAEERTQATVIFDKYVTDTLTLSPKQFTEVFNSMRANGEAMTGSVQYRLSPAETREVPFFGWLGKLVGPALEAELVSSTPDGTSYRVRVINRIESKVQLEQVAVSILKAPDGERVPAPCVDNPFPILELAPGACGEFDVRPEVPVLPAYGVRLEPLEMRVDLDFETLWNTVLQTPGWSDITHRVSVEVEPSYFSGANALTMVKVLFQYPEVTIELTSQRLTAEVNVMRPLIPMLLGLPSADSFFYRVESWRSASPSAPATQVASSPGWLLNEGGSVLTITPPR